MKRERAEKANERLEAKFGQASALLSDPTPFFIPTDTVLRAIRGARLPPADPSKFLCAPVLVRIKNKSASKEYQR